MSTVQEIQDAILHLPPQDRETLRLWLAGTEGEIPEMLAAIDEGLRSLGQKGVIPLEKVRQNIGFIGYQVGLTEEAQTDIGAVVRFLAEKSPEATKRIGHELLGAAPAPDRLSTPGLAGETSARPA